MGFLSNFLSVPSRNDPLHPWWYSILGRKVTSGVKVNHDTALNYSAVWAATRLLTGTISTLPRELYVQTGRSKMPAVGHPTRRAFKREPNDYQGGVVYHEEQFNYLINWGNAFAEKSRDAFGRVAKLWPIHPSRIPPENFDEDENAYYVNNDDLTRTKIPAEDLFHVPGLFPEDDRFGKGVIDHARESIGMGLATEQHGASFFGNGARPSVVLTHPRTLGEDGQKNLRKSWRERFSGPDKANGLLVLEEDIKLTTLTISPEQSQFLGTRQFNVTEIARWYNVPPHLLRELSKSSFNNIESESLHFILISVLPWLVRWEDECNRQLLMEGEKDSLFFKFNIHGMLRGDTKTQSQFFREMAGIGVFDINDIRELLDMNPVEHGDLRLVPMNMVPLEFAAKPPEPAPIVEEPQEEVEEEEEEPAEEQSEDSGENAVARAAVRYSLQCVLTGMIGYEARQAVRMAANPREFEARCHKFYDEKFKTTFANQIGPLLAGCRMLGSPVDVGEFVMNHIEKSKTELLALQDVALDQFAGAVQELVDSWDSRVTEDVDSVFGATVYWTRNRRGDISCSRTSASLRVW